MTPAATILHLLTEPLHSPVVARAAGELALLGVVSGVLGCWIVLWGLSYSAESLAHAMLPGLVLAALTGIPLLVGGAAGLLVAALAIALVGRTPVLDHDVAVAVVISTLLGLGVLLGLSPQTPAGLGSLLFGDVLAVGPLDLALAAGLGVVSLAVLGALHPTLAAVGFDRSAAVAGGRAATADVVLTVMLAAATLVAVQALGNLLVVAMLVGPAATARVLTRRLGPMMAVATLTAVAASLAGLYASYYARVAAGASVTAASVVAYLLALLVRGIREVPRAPVQAAR
jgi:ABC-type Mn2+/Zn2+ transport system permease subunit